MNKLFGFFKQKIVEAKVENKKELQSLVSVLSGDDSGYKSQMILSHLQKIKSNYMTWSILIANEASTGLYYSQLHNHGACLKKANLEKEFEVNRERHGIVLEQMKKTDLELKEVGKLSDKWVASVSQELEQIKQLRMQKLWGKKKKSEKKLQQTQQIQNSINDSKQGEKQVEQEGKKENKQNHSTIVLSQTSSPIIQFFQQQRHNQAIVVPQKW